MMYLGAKGGPGSSTTSYSRVARHLGIWRMLKLAGSEVSVDIMKFNIFQTLETWNSKDMPTMEKGDTEHKAQNFSLQLKAEQLKIYLFLIGLPQNVSFFLKSSFGKQTLIENSYIYVQKPDQVGFTVLAPSMSGSVVGTP